MDWDDLKVTLAITRHGSLNAAARALGTTQPTISRRLDRFERRIGVKLFERTASGLSPTPLCTALVESLNLMEDGAESVERRISARDTGLQGTITVTSLAWFGDDVVAPLLARFAAHHELVTIDLINDPRRFNLSRREADIALRIGSFDQQNLVERKVADVSYGLYASADYLNRHGRPSFRKGCAGHIVTSLVESPIKVVPIEWLERIAPRARHALKTNGMQSHVAAAEAGEAMAVLPRVLGDRRPALIRLEPPVPEPFQPVKLGVHADMRDTPRIRALIDFLVLELQTRSAELHPGAAVRSRRRDRVGSRGPLPLA
ncbi:MAG: LysR family transcriptional regulator [Gammaproteobacteria bacterium]|nr:LysR family transcriptional regulator [Gammaproteobacteria bacterium]